jgi:DNA-binding IclR family transcriptional regulator
MRLPAHLAATGKAMLAHQSPEFVRRLYAGRALQRMAGGGAATPGELAKELAQVRERGYSVDDASIRQGVYCVAAPVFDAAGQAVAGVGVCSHKTARGAAGRGRSGDHRDAVREVARLLSQRIGAPSPAPAVAAPARRAPAKRARA